MSDVNIPMPAMPSIPAIPAMPSVPPVPPITASEVPTTAPAMPTIPTATATPAMPTIPAMPEVTIPMPSVIDVTPVAVSTTQTEETKMTEQLVPPMPIAAPTTAAPAMPVAPAMAAPVPAAPAAPVAEVPPAPAMMATPVAPAAPISVAPAIPEVPQAPVPAAMPAMVPAATPAPATMPVTQEQHSMVTVGPDGFPQGGSMTEIFAAMGFEGISTDIFGIMPIITLTQGEFMRDKVAMVDQEFFVQILSSRPKYLYSYGSGQSAGLFYTYDKQHDANNPEFTINQFEAKAAERGEGVSMTEYYEIDAIMHSNNEAVKLSVPKRGSGTAFVKFLTQCAAARRRPQDAVVKVKRGERVTNVQHPFYPWAFEIAGWRA